MSDIMKLRVIPPLPRKYEDTKPALNQAFTHAAIIDIGRKIAEKSNDNKEFEKQISLKQCEEDVWKRAEAYKDECVFQAIKEANANEERRIERIQALHEKQMRKEISRMEGIMQHRCFEKVHEERKKGEMKLNEIVAKLHTNFAIEKAVALEQARKQEMQTAAANKEELERQHREDLKQQHQRDEEEKRFALNALRKQSTIELNRRVEETKIEGSELADEMLKEATEYYDMLIADMKEEMRQLETKLEDTEIALNKMEDLKNSKVAKLKQMRQSFVDFTEACRPDFSGGQADYLLPELSNDDN